MKCVPHITGHERSRACIHSCQPGAFHHESGGWRDKGKKTEIKADMTLFELVSIRWSQR